MPAYIGLLTFFIIGIPFAVYALFSAAARAKEQGNIAKQWFLIWVIVIITIALTLLGLAMIFTN